MPIHLGTLRHCESIIVALFVEGRAAVHYVLGILLELGFTHRFC